MQNLNNRLPEQEQERLQLTQRAKTNVVNVKPLKVALVQINNSFSGQNYLPYAAGLLQSYTQKYAKKPERS